MLRFRPIAPKPVSAKETTASGGSSSDNRNALSSATRPKRKYVRSVKYSSSTNKSNTRRKSTTLSPEQKQHPVPVVTLPLLPETPDLKDLTLPATKEVLNNNNNTNKSIPLWLSFDNLSDTKVEPYRYHGSTSYVTVESVMDTWLEGESIGSTDYERRVNLGKDTCPCFISNGYGSVTWMNGAYREMVGEGACVLLAMEKNVSVTVTNPLSFTCRVRVVEYDTCGKDRNSFTVPCDMWRMDFGFAWRLDVKAALSLSLGR
ncbi:unnamed protein product [Lupinus luteus]|uniref:DUF7950 domain-containing protein n=1 Tax=Lupinus luteus TaxID=3873 RepID=A0AAV1XU09_LUPLU